MWFTDIILSTYVFPHEIGEVKTYRVFTLLNVVQNQRSETEEISDRSGYILTINLHRYVLIIGEVVSSRDTHLEELVISRQLRHIDLTNLEQ